MRPAVLRRPTARDETTVLEETDGA